MRKLFGTAVAAMTLAFAGSAGAYQLYRFDVVEGTAALVSNTPDHPRACLTDPCTNISGARLESENTFTLREGRNDYAGIVLYALNSGSGFDETFYMGFVMDGVDYKTYFTIPADRVWSEQLFVSIKAPSPTSVGRWLIGSDGPYGPNIDFVNPSAVAVPEPATWAMMIIGFGAVGSMVRTTRRRNAFAAA